MLNITPPSALQGNEQAQLTQVYRYLFRLSEQLNMALVETDAKVEHIQAAGNTASKGGSEDDSKLKASLAEQYNSLKSLIIKTAETVRAEMDVIKTELNSKYEAISEDWGTYKEEVNLEIEQTAKATVENYKYIEQITEVQGELTADFEAYRIETQGYIKRGIIGYDDENYPIFGIAIGQELKSSTVTIDGVEYEEFDTTVNMATYTADKLSFWINGVEVAYLSNSELEVTRIIVSDSIKLGNWDIAVNDAEGMTIQKRIGSELDLSENNTITIKADQITQIADQIDLKANNEIKLLLGGHDDVQRWFTFDDVTGLTIQKPKYTDKDGNEYPASIWSTVTDETGYHIKRSDMTGYVASFHREQLDTKAVCIGGIACRALHGGGWTWTDD